MTELPDYPDLALVAACEERIVNAWPAPSTLMVEGWVVRFANGYSGRANSASPLTAGATLSESALAQIERLYAEAHLPPCIRLTPLTASGMARRLAARGYRIRDRALGMVAALADAAPTSSTMHIEPRASRGWVEAVAALQSPEKNDPDKLAAIVGGVRMPAVFARLDVDGAAVALGMSVAERGMAEIGSIIVDEARRGSGHGRALVRGLMDWAASQQCHTAYLQVEASNAPAIGLYESLGFRPAYAYGTWVRDGASVSAPPASRASSRRWPPAR
jgi:ribosomal protein S18 acetylase RimI-like enzyme